jgi:hypothetical protein
VAVAVAAGTAEDPIEEECHDRPLPVRDVTAIAAGLARFEARGPCTDAERRAANWLHDELRRGGREAWVETYWVRPQWTLVLALHAALGVVASVLAISAPLPGLVLALVAAVSAAAGAAGVGAPLQWVLPRRATQNVIVEPPEGGTTLLIAAPYAAPKAGIGARFIAGRELWVAAALLLVAACAGLRQLDLDGVWLGVLQFLPTLFLLLALAAAVDAAVASPAGGEQPAAVAVALFEQIDPERLSPGLLLYGARRAHLRRDRPDVVLELGLGGSIDAEQPDALERARALVAQLDAEVR